ncbi:unnamed protein product [Microthlaspi erraticum]|uniref:Uncharacterized protein n=1 Tax=Microthlaspi erraticum TaxID=1685480 RepID=A0A6D2JVU0_9BRAS|nr:unnamed protein product [Microthlaspi erraticum]
MSRYVCGSHELKSNASIVPPKELGGKVVVWRWETAIRSTPLDGFTRSIELAAPLLPLLHRSVCGSLGLGGAWLARLSIGVPSTLRRLLVRRWIVLKSRISNWAPPGQLDPQLDRVEFPLFGLDRVRWSSGASGLGTLPPSLRVVFSFPWLECEALGQGASLEW